MIKISPVARQFLTIFCCNLSTISVGLSNGWATIYYIDLQNENSTFPSGALTTDELALVISITYAGSFIGNFAVMPMSRTFGIKRTIHFFGVPLILTCLLIIWAKNVYYLYASRLLVGFVGGALAVAIPIFVNDISFNNVRGALNALYDPSFNFGMIVSFFLGNNLNWLEQAKLQLTVPVIFTIIIFFLPESPEFWRQRNNDKQQNRSRTFYRGKDTRPENLELLQMSLNEKTENGKLKCNDSRPKTLVVTILKALKSRSTKRALFVSFTSITLSFLCGTLIMYSYVTKIFIETGSSLSEKNSSILASIVMLLGNLVFLNIVERIDRKTLYIGSAILTAICYFSFAGYCFLWLKHPDYQWMSPILVASIIFFSCLGLVPIPYTISIEIFAKEIRELCLAMAVSLIWLVLFVLGYIFPLVLDSIGLVYCMTILGVMCLLNVAFGIFFIPETRGKSHEEIMEIMGRE